MKDKKLIIFLIILIPCILYLARYVISSNQTNSPHQNTAEQKLQTQPPSKISTSGTGTTSKNWKTFGSSIYGVHFKCPYSWQANDDQSDTTTYVAIFTDSINGQNYTFKVTSNKNVTQATPLDTYTANNVVWNVNTDTKSNQVGYTTAKNGYEYSFYAPISQAKSDNVTQLLASFIFTSPTGR